jgi:hypothetical protein
VKGDLIRDFGNLEKIAPITRPQPGQPGQKIGDAGLFSEAVREAEGKVETYQDAAGRSGFLFEFLK